MTTHFRSDRNSNVDELKYFLEAKRIQRRVLHRVIGVERIDSKERMQKKQFKLKALIMLKYAISLNTPEMEEKLALPLTEEENSPATADMTSEEQVWRHARLTSAKQALYKYINYALEKNINHEILNNLLTPETRVIISKQRKNTKRSARRRRKRKIKKVKGEYIKK